MISSSSLLWSRWYAARATQVAARSLLLMFAATSATTAQKMDETLRAADRLSPDAMKRSVLNASVMPVWAQDGKAFIYRREIAEGASYVKVSPVKRQSLVLFTESTADARFRELKHEQTSTGRLLVAQDQKHPGRILITARDGDTKLTCDESAIACSIHIAPFPRGCVGAPSGRECLAVRNNNLVRVIVGKRGFLRSTRDGSKDTPYGLAGDAEEHAAHGDSPAPVVAWSPNSRYAATIRLNQLGVSRAFVFPSVLEGSSRTVSFAYPMGADPVLPTAKVAVLDTQNGRLRMLQSDTWPLATSPIEGPPDEREMWWSNDSTSLYWLQRTRGSRCLSLWRANVAAGTTRKVIEECSKTQVRTSNSFETRNVRTLANGDILWFSERDGWGHLYRYNSTGRLLNQVTQGNWLVRQISFVDEQNGFLYFTAGGFERGHNPYFRQLYRIELDGKNLRTLTSADADHEVAFSPDGRFFTDVVSRTDLPPVSLLCDSDGHTLLKLETADASRLTALGYRPPVPFIVKAADGHTDLYGALYLPTTFRPTQKYAVLEDIYPLLRTPVRYSEGPFMADFGSSTSELGLVVMVLNARGGVQRSRGFRDATYGHVEGEIEDHVAALRQLSQRYPYLDLSRVGIYGHSVGGEAAAMAAALHPEVYRVAICSSGVMDLRLANAEWIESWVGPITKDDLFKISPVGHVTELMAQMLIANGELDHPALTLRFSDALISAGKSFELMLIPNRGHGVPSAPQFLVRKSDFLVKNLIGASTTNSFPAEKEVRK